MFGNDSGLPNNLRFRNQTDTQDLTIERDILPNYGKPSILMLDPYKNANQWLDNAIDVQLRLLFAQREKIERSLTSNELQDFDREFRNHLSFQNFREKIIEFYHMEQKLIQQYSNLKAHQREKNAQESYKSRAFQFHDPTQPRYQEVKNKDVMIAREVGRFLKQRKLELALKNQPNANKRKRLEQEYWKQKPLQKMIDEDYLRRMMVDKDVRAQEDQERQLQEQEFYSYKELQPIKFKETELLTHDEKLEQLKVDLISRRDDKLQNIQRKDLFFILGKMMDSVARGQIKDDREGEQALREFFRNKEDNE